MTSGNALLRPFDARALSAFLVLVGLALSRASELTQSPISCECHCGDFSNDFSPPDFDINGVDCRVSWIKNSPTIRFWSTAPYLGIRWPQRVL
ncbi:MAG: hypothetical protein ACT4O2_10650 [Beijerinckiaceae bacterium]